METADRLGYRAIELRGVAGEMDFPEVPEFTGTRLADAKKDLAAAGIYVSGFGASARMHEKEPGVRAQQLDEGRRFIDSGPGHGREVRPRVRRRDPSDEPKEDVMKRVVEGFRTLADYAKDSA